MSLQITSKRIWTFKGWQKLLTFLKVSELEDLVFHFNGLQLHCLLAG